MHTLRLVTITTDTPGSFAAWSASLRVALDDAGWSRGRGPRIEVLRNANDSDPDGSIANLTPALINSPTAFVLNNDKTVTVRASAGFTGLLRGNYQLTDQDGLKSSPVNIDVMVIDYSRSRPWQSPRTVTDVNDDNSVTPSDALTIINYLNSGREKLLPVAGATNIFGFLDVKADGLVTPSDALQIINQLNSSAGGEGEDVKQSSPAAIDVAISQMTFAEVCFSAEDLVRERVRSRFRRESVRV